MTKDESATAATPGQTMNHELMRAVAALTQRLMAQAAWDDGLREDLRALAAAVLRATERLSPMVRTEPGPEAARGEEPGRTGPESSPAVEAKSAAPEALRPAPPLPELTLGRSRPAEAVGRAEPSAYVGKASTADAELPAVEARCRLKTEGVRWAATRRRRIVEGAEFRVEIAPRDREILDRAKNIDCYLWMNTPDFTVPNEPAPLEDVAGCYETVAEAIALVRRMLPDAEANREFFEPALDLLAEAQSALRVAIDRIDGPSDPDQFRAYDWLRGVASREQIYIQRYMRIDDPADPARHSRVADRIEALDTRFQEVRQRVKSKKSQLNRLRYHAKLISEGTGGEYHWRKVAGAIDEIIGEGVPASSVEVREVLLPLLDGMPDLDELPAGFGLVLREIDRYQAGRMAPREVAAAETPTPQVAEVARLLAGRSVVLIGGSRRPEAAEALEAALGLKELVWIETREHESSDKFEPFVARPDVALVLLAIRWSSHSFSDVKRYCDQYDKPMVRLPAGYNPNQVAAQILDQCSGQLGGR